MRPLLFKYKAGTLPGLFTDLRVIPIAALRLVVQGLFAGATNVPRKADDLGAGDEFVTGVILPD